MKTQVDQILEKLKHPSRLQASSEKMCRLYEDQMNEAKAKADELQRQLNENNTQRARAQTESGKRALTGL